MVFSDKIPIVTFLDRPFLETSVVLSHCTSSSFTMFSPESSEKTQRKPIMLSDF